MRQHTGGSSIEEVVFYTVASVLLSLGAVGFVVNKLASIAVRREIERQEHDPENQP